MGSNFPIERVVQSVVQQHTKHFSCLLYCIISRNLVVHFVSSEEDTLNATCGLKLYDHDGLVGHNYAETFSTVITVRQLLL